jgi:hypothetical protein
MRRVLVGFLEVTAGLAIFIAVIAVYNWLHNWADPWEPGTWGYQIGLLLPWLVIGMPVILVITLVVWMAITALVARLRHLR